MSLEDILPSIARLPRVEGVTVPFILGGTSLLYVFLSAWEGTKKEDISLLLG